MRSWWWKNPEPVAPRERVATSKPAPETSDDVGRYQHLYKYLRDRYANRIVLTFGEIEDILGFSLPAPARIQRQWWGDQDGQNPPTAQSDAWTLASRTASVNLMAQTVLFERQTAGSSL